MPRTIENTVYKFDELSDSAKEKAREWFRSSSAGDDYWSECVLDDAQTILKHLGYLNPNIFYRGFWSQGCGACFAASWYSSDCKPLELCAYAPVDKELTRIADALAALIAAHPGMSATIRHSGHYYHEMCTRFDIGFNEDDDSELTDDALETLQAARGEADEEFTELSRDLMRWIYKTLETEYEYQNADAQVDENIICNEYEFDEDGDRA